MNPFAAIIMAVAAILFLLEAYTLHRAGASPLVALGLCLFDVGLMVQFLTLTHAWHF